MAKKATGSKRSSRKKSLSRAHAPLGVRGYQGSVEPLGREDEDTIQEYRVLRTVVRAFSYEPQAGAPKKYKADIVPSHFTQTPYDTVLHAMDAGRGAAKAHSFEVYERSELNVKLQKMQNDIDARAKKTDVKTQIDNAVAGLKAEISQLRTELNKLKTEYKRHIHNAKISGPVSG